MAGISDQDCQLIFGSQKMGRYSAGIHFKYARLLLLLSPHSQSTFFMVTAEDSQEGNIGYAQPNHKFAEYIVLNDSDCQKQYKFIL